MATLFRKPRSPFWYASYFDGTGYRVRHSPKEKSRHRALVAAAAMEERARRANAEEELRRIDPEWEPPAPKTVFFVDDAQTLITTNESPDLSFDASLNPYRGCEHGCVS